MFKRSEYIYIGIVIIYGMLSLFVVGNSISSCSEKIEKHGLKTIIEEIWEGRDK